MKYKRYYFACKKTRVENPNELISFDTQEMTYTASAKTKTITEGSKRMYFTYGADDERVMTKLVELDGGNETTLLTKYFFGLYEQESEGAAQRHIHYIIAGDGLTAIVVEENTIASTYFTYKDHLGSIVALTDEEGDVFFEQSFDAWGKYRNPDNWMYNDIPDPPTWLRGYTGHEHLQYFDLINMNGRMYDPALGRMLRPDNLVPDPLFSQAYNRYAYGLNNPLKYTDPDGELPVLVGVAIGAIVGAYIGGAVANQDFAFWNWDYSNSNTWVGIGAGAVIGAITGGLAAKAGGGAGLAFIKKGTAKNLSASMVAGTQNVLYQYDPERGYGWHSLAQFGAGFAGSYIGAATGSTLAAFGTGGLFNTAVNGMDYSINGKEFNGYSLAQWFVGGGLTAYGGTKMAGAGNWNAGQYVFDKGTDKALDYGLQSLASDFAYDKDQKFFKKSVGDHFMTFSRGFLSGGMQGIAGYNSFVTNVDNNPVFSRQAIAGTLYGASFAIEYGLYGLQKAMGTKYNFYGGGAMQKAGIYHSKILFYSLSIY